MTFETLNNNVILVELSYDEMRKYNITYEALDNQDTNTRVAIRKLLDHIDTEKSIRNSGKVVVETLPIEGGGCFFIFTFMQVRRKYKLKKHEEIRLFSLENLNDFLDLICTIRKNPDKDVFLTAYEMGNDYFVSAPADNIKLNTILKEFGKSIDKITSDRVLEYGKNLGKIYLQ